MGKDYKCEMFGGENCEQYNAMMTALVHASVADGHQDNEKIYKFLDLPKSSLVCELVDALNQVGYQITRK
jgi:hypothetical protein